MIQIGLGSKRFISMMFLTQSFDSSSEGQSSPCWDGRRTFKGLSTFQSGEYFKIMSLGKRNRAISSEFWSSSQNEQSFRLSILPKWKVLDFFEIYSHFFHSAIVAVERKWKSRAGMEERNVNNCDYLGLKNVKACGKNSSTFKSRKFGYKFTLRNRRSFK